MQPIVLSYENAQELISVEIYDNNVCVLLDCHITDVNYLAESNGTVYLHLAPDGIGRCYKQSLQITTTRWKLWTKTRQVVVYQRELSEYGAISGESNIIHEDGSIDIVTRYDTEIYYRDPTNVEHIIWQASSHPEGDLPS